MQIIRNTSQIDRIEHASIRDHLLDIAEKTNPFQGWGSVPVGLLAIATPADSISHIEKKLGFPIFHPGKQEWVTHTHDSYEISAILDDSGRFIVLIIPDTPDMNRSILRFCRRQCRKSHSGCQEHVP